MLTALVVVTTVSAASTLLGEHVLLPVGMLLDYNL